MIEFKEKSMAERALKYASKITPAIEGNGGDKQTYIAMSNLYKNFPEDVADEALRTYNATCNPPWEWKELMRKKSYLKEWYNPDGSVTIKNNRKSTKEEVVVEDVVVVGGKKQADGKLNKVPLYKAFMCSTTDIPTPMENGAIEMIRAMFNSGEYVHVCVNHLVNDGRTFREQPLHGLTLERDQLIKELEVHKGNIYDVFRARKMKCEDIGSWICINPIKSCEGGNPLSEHKDVNITSYRHVLVEFDHIPKESQWNILKTSQIPIAAIVDSGNRSIHGIVKVNAQTLEDYTEAVNIIKESFKEFGIDTNNVNPSRYSRLAGQIRRN